MTQDIIVALAQFTPIRGDVKYNIQQHLTLVLQAVEERANIIIFPELSLTGYELDLANDLAMIDDDAYLFPFIELAQKHNLTIIVGAFIASKGTKPKIGEFIISPDGSVSHYCKMHLHSGENDFVSPGCEEKVIYCNGNAIALAICADINQPAHANNYAKTGASMYLSSVLITANGYHKDTTQLCESAINGKFIVAMANYSGLTGGWMGIGKSAIWDQHGQLIAQAPEHLNALVIGSRKSGQWTGKVITK